jgi:hypothetical protein
MSTPDAHSLQIRVNESQSVDALYLQAPGARACLALGHGAGAGMAHPSMATIAMGLHALGVSTLRYQFPYMQRGSRRTDPPPLCHATVRAAVATATELAPGTPLFAGGRSFGGRMTSQAQALEPLAAVRGLVFFAFPLHPAGKPATDRAQHLQDVNLPMLFLQGTEDDLARLDLLQSVTNELGSRAGLQLLQDADHAFHVPVRSGRRDTDVRDEALQAVVQWIARITHG